MIGQTLAHYRITGSLGEGGMGVVYRALDPRLNRDVAIKLLPETVAKDPDRLARFRREAQVLASLSHSNIGQIYGIEEADGQQALILELIEGETLAERLERGPLELEPALTVARQIARALEAAHSKGIVHRDLKPANIKISPSGEVKVLDFGLAKAWDSEQTDPSLSHSPTLTLQATQAGIILGTAGYMSPEQARGEPVDKRADTWALGVLLYEMLTGKRVFQGTTVSDVLASVLKEEPDWSALPDVPPSIQRLLTRCLEKDPLDRLRDAGDALLEMNDWKTESGGVRESTQGLRLSLPTLGISMIGIVLVTVFGTSYLLDREPPASSTEVWKTTIAVPEQLVLAGNRPRISPDGKKIVYFDGQGLRIHQTGRFDGEPINDTAEVEAPFFSADSERVAFSVDSTLWQSRLDGSERRMICAIPGGRDAADGYWMDDGTIVFSTFSGGLYRVPSQGGTPEVIMAPGTKGAGQLLVFPLPGRDRFVFSRYTTGGLLRLDDGIWEPILEDDDVVTAAYSPTGHILFSKTAEGLWAAPFSLDTGQITGGAFQVDPAGGFPSVSISGRLLYYRGRDRSQLIRVDRKGEFLEAIGPAQFMLQDPALSPDGRWVAVFAREQGDFGMWLHDTRNSTARRLTFETSPTYTSPAWGPGGDLFFTTRDDGIWQKNATSGEKAIRVAQGVTPHVSRDGEILVFARTSDQSPSREGEIVYLNLKEDGEPQPLGAGVVGSRPRLSPDNRWIAYSSARSGNREVFVRRFPSGEGPWQISTQGGNFPRWSAEGDELFFLDGNLLMSVTVQRSETFESERPVTMLRLPAPAFKEYEVLPEKQGFILVRPSAEVSSLAVVENWFAEFDQGITGQ